MASVKKLTLLVIAVAVVITSCDGDGSNLPSSLPSLPTTTVDGATTITVDETSTTLAREESTTTEAEVTTTLPP